MLGGWLLLQLVEMVESVELVRLAELLELLELQLLDIAAAAVLVAAVLAVAVADLTLVVDLPRVVAVDIDMPKPVLHGNNYHQQEIWELQLSANWLNG